MRFKHENIISINDIIRTPTIDLMKDVYPHVSAVLIYGLQVIPRCCDKSRYFYFEGSYQEVFFCLSKCRKKWYISTNMEYKYLIV